MLLFDCPFYYSWVEKVTDDSVIIIVYSAVLLKFLSVIIKAMMVWWDKIICVKKCVLILCKQSTFPNLLGRALIKKITHKINIKSLRILLLLRRMRILATQFDFSNGKIEIRTYALNFWISEK